MKRGISPLIATVLLLVLSVALGAVVMTFTETSTENIANTAGTRIETSLKCELGIVLQIVDYENVPQICYNRSGTDNFEVLLKNPGDESISGIRLFLVDSNNKVVQKNILTPINAQSRAMYDVNISTTDDGSHIVFPLDIIEIAPIITTGDTRVICKNDEIEVDEIEVCR